MAPGLEQFAQRQRGLRGLAVGCHLAAAGADIES
jgi:hypothetical protein